MSLADSPLAITLSPTAMRLAAEVNAIVMTTIDYVYAQEAAVMERLYHIRQEFEDDAGFCQFVAQATNLKPQDALNRVLTWQSSRQSRDLRELAQQRPVELMRTIVALTEEEIDPADRDEEVTRLMALPVRKRNKAIRSLIERSRDPDDAPDTPAAGADNVVPIAAQSRAQLRDLTKISTQLTTLLAGIGKAVDDYSPTQTDKALALLDQMMGALEGVSGALLDDET